MIHTQQKLASAVKFCVADLYNGELYGGLYISQQSNLCQFGNGPLSFSAFEIKPIFHCVL